MMQCHEEEFFKSMIRRHRAIIESYNFTPKPELFSFVSGQLDGMREAIRLFAIQTGKPMKDNESIKEYYERWLSMEYAQTDIPDKMAELEVLE